MKDYTKEELKYNQKSAAASFFGSASHSFANVGLRKSPKARLILGVGGLTSTLGLSTYYDIKSFKASKRKGRNIGNMILRNLSFGFLGGVAGAGSAIGTLAALKKVKKVSSKVASNETLKFYRAKPVNQAAKLSSMMKDKAVRFIRVRGRIVPIKAKTVRQGPALLTSKRS